MAKMLDCDKLELKLRYCVHFRTKPPNLFAQLPVDHLCQDTLPALVLFLDQFYAFAYVVYHSLYLDYNCYSFSVIYSSFL